MIRFNFSDSMKVTEVTHYVCIFIAILEESGKSSVAFVISTWRRLVGSHHLMTTYKRFPYTLIRGWTIGVLYLHSNFSLQQYNSLYQIDNLLSI